MASDKQIKANRQNALSSTGPSTAAGKGVSSQNAITHGLSANRPLLKWENPAVYESFHAGMFRERSPQGTLECTLTERLVNILWRLRRIPMIEACLWEWIGYDQTPFSADTENDAAEKSPDEIVDERRFIGNVIQIALERDLTGKLSRHEAGLMKQYLRTSAELDRLRSDRIRARNGSRLPEEEPSE